MPVNKILKDTQPDTINQNDPCHQANTFEKEMIKITKRSSSPRKGLNYKFILIML